MKNAILPAAVAALLLLTGCATQLAGPAPSPSEPFAHPGPSGMVQIPPAGGSLDGAALRLVPSAAGSGSAELLAAAPTQPGPLADWLARHPAGIGLQVQNGDGEDTVLLSFTVSCGPAGASGGGFGPSGTWTLQGDALVPGALVTPTIGCLDDDGRDVALEFVSHPLTFAVADGVLELGDGTETIPFARVHPTPGTPPPTPPSPPSGVASSEPSSASTSSPVVNPVPVSALPPVGTANSIPPFPPLSR